MPWPPLSQLHVEMKGGPATPPRIMPGKPCSQPWGSQGQRGRPRSHEPDKWDSPFEEILLWTPLNSLVSCTAGECTPSEVRVGEVGRDRQVYMF